VTQQVDRRADATRLLILQAASREFARKSYSQVSLDDILAQAMVTKGAMYFHFSSKHELALAIIERQRQAGYETMSEVLSRKLSGLETLVDMSYLIASSDIGDGVTRAGLNLLESIGRTEGVQLRVLGEWIQTLTAIVRNAIAQGDVLAERDPEDVSRMLVSMYMGIRHTSDPDDPERFLTDVERTWKLVLPGFANPDRIGYLYQFIGRRTALAIKKATPLNP
jgi:AcrR family transcriptional regulator